MEETSKHEQEKNKHIEEACREMHAMRASFRKSMQAWLPEGVLENHREARKHLLLGIRSLIDAAIEHTEK